MCNDCDDDNITALPVGPVGPTGATGTSPLVTGTATDNVLTSTGTRVWTGFPAETAWVSGMRLRAANDDLTKILEGEVVTFTAGTLTLDVDYVEGSGSDNAWTLGIAGARGATGSAGSTGATGADGVAGKNAYGTTSAIATSLGANLYTVPLTNTYWGVVGQYIYIGTAGYYQITAINAGVSFQVLDLLYTGNTPANMVASSGLGVSPSGIRGATGSTGATGATGATGSPGADGAGASFSNVVLASTPVTASTDVVMIASVATSGSLVLNSQFEFESTDPVNVTIKLLLNGVEQTAANNARGTSPTAVSALSILNLPYVNQFDVTAGDVVAFRITLSNYAVSTDVTARFVYTIS
jgi:hypothetical protein